MPKRSKLESHASVSLVLVIISHAPTRYAKEFSIDSACVGVDTFDILGISYVLVAFQSRKLIPN